MSRDVTLPLNTVLSLLLAIEEGDVDECGSLLSAHVGELLDEEIRDYIAQFVSEEMDESEDDYSSDETAEADKGEDEGEEFVGEWGSDMNPEDARLILETWRDTYLSKG